MILAKARLIQESDGRMRVGLTFPTGFELEEVVPESVRGNARVPPDEVHVPPRRGTVEDIYRELELSFPAQALSAAQEGGASITITGTIRRRMQFTALLRLPAGHRGEPSPTAPAR